MLHAQCAPLFNRSALGCVQTSTVGAVGGKNA
jgi:hypothetical protein